jgi:NAD(P)-dependent dehydrogenase (short-subunit alcohol dehydrogenase family)
MKKCSSLNDCHEILENSKAGIRVNAVGPALIRTPMIEGVTADPGATEVLTAAHPIGMLGQFGQGFVRYRQLLSR